MRGRRTRFRGIVEALLLARRWPPQPGGQLRRLGRFVAHVRRGDWRNSGGTTNVGDQKLTSTGQRPLKIQRSKRAGECWLFPNQHSKMAAAPPNKDLGGYATLENAAAGHRRPQVRLGPPKPCCSSWRLRRAALKGGAEIHACT